MTFLSDKELASIANNELALEFLKAKLVQQGTDSPRTYNGAGSVVQDKSGQLLLKMYSPFESSEDGQNELARMFSSSDVEPGQLLRTQDHFAFEGVDFHGQVWTATDVWINVDVSYPAAGRLIRSQLKSIESRDERLKAQNRAGSRVYIVPGTYLLPFNKTQPDTSEPGLSACTIDLGAGGVCDIRTRGQALILAIDLQDGAPDSYPQRILEAIGLCSGSHLAPQVEIAQNEKKRIQIIRCRQNDANDHQRIVPPIPLGQPGAFEGLQEFVQLYLRRIDEPYSQLAGYVYRTLAGFHSGLENQALVLTTAIEGVTKIYFGAHSGPDREFVAQLDDARVVVENAEVGERALNLLLSCLGNAKTPRVKNVLTSLASTGRIPTTLIKTWTRLRNKSAHADELKLGYTEYQIFINDVYACLELFYRLVMLHIDFKGNMIRYSEIGWPIQKVTDFGPTISKHDVLTCEPAKSAITSQAK